MGHIGFQYIQWLIRTGSLEVQEKSKAASKFKSPKCAVCEFGDGRHLSNKVNTIKNNCMKYQELKKYHILPGQMVYTDHHTLRAPGRLYHTKGK